jgi:hypothetical protein
LLGIIVLVVTAGTPTTAFTSGSLTRGSAATVADDANGIIGLDVAGSVSAGASSRIITVTNPLDRPLDVEVTAGSVSLSNTQATLDPGQALNTSATVSCDSPPDTATVTVVVTSASQFSGTATRSVTVDTSDCSASSGPFSPGSASADSFSGPGGGDTGSVEFPLNNVGTTARTITGFELVAAGDATTLSFDGPKPVNVEQGKDEVYIDATGGTTDSEGAAEDARRDTVFSLEDGVTHSLDQNVTVDAGESVQVSLYQFIEADGTSYRFQPGDEVTVAFTLQDGTQSTVTVTIL